VALVVCALAAAAGLVAGALVVAGARDGDASTVVRRTQQAVSNSASPTTPFYGNLYTASIPAGWIQEEDEALASDGSYIENTWSSPAGDEGLKIDESPGDPADPAESATSIAADLRAADETVYSVRHGVVRGGVVGSEIAFRANSGLPERVDFFFNLGDNGFAVLGSAYDIETARRLVGPLVASIETTE
ncbi:MAG: hypothetical protein WA687_13145, partial [Solirubrobacterales bacterium]